MPATTEAPRQFTIPTTAELEQLEAEIAAASTKVEELSLSLLHATGGVDVPLVEFARKPTLENIGSLFSSAYSVEVDARHLEEMAVGITKLLGQFDSKRLEQGEG